MRTMGWVACLVSVSALTACRFGFDELSFAPPGTDDDGVITTPPVPGVAHVQVIGEDGETRVGQPIANAYVVAIEQDGTTTTARTGIDGNVEIEIAGNTALHIARQLENGEWALSSFRALNDGAKVLVGGNPSLVATAQTSSLSIDLPAFPTGYTEASITGPRSCLIDMGYAAASLVPLAYDPKCEGTSVELYAFSGDLFVAIGSVTLTNTATIDRTTASWADLDKVAMKFSNLPAEVTSAGALLAFPAMIGDQIPITDDFDTPDAEGKASAYLDIPQPIPPGSLVAAAFVSPAGVYLAIEQIDEWSGNRLFDAAMVAPPPSVPAIDTTAAQLTWSDGGAADSDLYWLATDLTIGGTIVHWSAFGPASATQATYPVLPAELAALAPTPTTTWSEPIFLFAGLSDYSYASVVEFVERDIWWWISEGLYMPSGKLSLSLSLP